MSFDLTPDTPINIRPSGVSSFMSCPRKWAATNLMGYRGWGSYATVRGTGVHAGAEQIWTESITKGDKIINVSQAQDAARESVKKEFQEADIRLDKDNFAESEDNAIDDATAGAKQYCVLAEDIDVPQYTEKTLEISLGDNITVRGTADFIGSGVIEDIKTSTRKSTPQQHAAQLGVYAKLAKLNGIDVSLEDARIQNIAYTKNKVSGYLLPFKLKEQMSSYLINTLKDRIVIARQNPLEIDLLFPANPSSYLCAEKYCPMWHDCDAHG